jgi:monoamine oxidase
MTKQKEIFDILIIGAGAAGLAAAEELRKKKKKFLILEARDRVGGRVWTEEKISAEYGPEFIHGKVPRIYKNVGSHFKRVPDLHLVNDSKNPQGGWIRSDDFWDKMSEILKHPPPEKNKEPFASYFIRVERPSIKQKKMVFAYVEGFLAADPNKVAAVNVYGALESEDAEVSYWPRGGYTPLLQKLFSKVLKGGFIHTNSAVKKVRWKKNSADLHCVGGRIFHAKKVIVTCPIGVLKKKTIRFSPSPALLKRALSRVQMGQIIKLNFLLNNRWRMWMKKYVPKHRGFVFFHADSSPVGVFWLRMDLPHPILTVWVGHATAKKMVRLSRHQIIQQITKESAHVFGMSLAAWKKMVTKIYFHHWSGDPYSEGAYAYFEPGGNERLSELYQKGISDTLYFAGEAFADERSGTVDGAIRNGRDLVHNITKTNSATASAR